MTLTAEQPQIAAFIDKAVSAYPDTEKGTEARLQNRHDYMEAFKRLMEISTTPEMNRLREIPALSSPGQAHGATGRGPGGGPI